MRRLALLFLLLLVSCQPHAEKAGRQAPVLTAQVQESYPHDAASFTQGLLWQDGKLYESSGNYGRSSISIREPRSGRILHSQALAEQEFGEGLALVGDELYQLTWKEFKLHVYDRHTLQRKRSLDYAWEGWGLAYDGKHLVASDGSDVLRFLDPKTLQVARSIAVRDGGQPIRALNELEVIDGEIYANVYGADRIARIDAGTGEVKAWLDLSHLYPAELRSSSVAVMNGIAYDPQRRLLLVTGKYWPRLYLIPLPKFP